MAQRRLRLAKNRIKPITDRWEQHPDEVRHPVVERGQPHRHRRVAVRIGIGRIPAYRVAVARR